MSQVIIAGDTSGTITLQAPAVSGSTVLTLPATTATLATLTTPSFASTIGVGGTTAANTGAGISFPATQSASSDANTLDDYEEGTWTPSVGGTATYNNRTGVYTKVGRIVTISFDIGIGTLGTGSVNTLSGLPFAQGPAVVRSGITVAYYANLAVSVIYMVGVVDGQATSIFFSSSAASSATITDSISLFGNNTRVIGSGTYITAT